MILLGSTGESSRQSFFACVPSPCDHCSQGAPLISRIVSPSMSPYLADEFDTLPVLCCRNRQNFIGFESLLMMDMRNMRRACSPYDGTNPRQSRNYQINHGPHHEDLENTIGNIEEFELQA